MDGSLSDFQIKKKYNRGPKKVKKSRTIKKLPKCTSDQNDIRVLIKRKENEVVTYSKDFNKVCMQTGIDVDSEELQLAIALSKSLLDVEHNSHIECANTNLLTSKQRSLEIKTTLQQYGFKISKTKSSRATNRIKKYRKQYKLLLLSQIERQQNISDKYSEVLAVNIFNSPSKVSEQTKWNDKELYYKATNISYAFIKNDNVYYVKDLFSKPSNKPSLLRDWSEIPGRPLSPTVPNRDINFDDITCNQNELDYILSGSIFTAQQTIAKTINIACSNSVTKEMEGPVQLEVNNKSVKAFNMSPTDTCYNQNIPSVLQHVRCISPDLFDDEVSLIMEGPVCNTNTNRTILKSDNNKTCHMDLTECVNINYANDKYNTTKVQATHSHNITNRKSNDFMEITDCVMPVPISKEENNESIDLTQCSNESNKHSNNMLFQNDTDEIMDLPQFLDEQPLLSCAKKDISLDNSIILLEDTFDLKAKGIKESLIIQHIPEPICIDEFEEYDKHYCEKDLKDSFMNTLSSDCSENKKNELCIEIIAIDEESNVNLKPKENLPSHTLLKSDQSPYNFEEVLDNNLSIRSTCGVYNNSSGNNYSNKNDSSINIQSDKLVNEVECPLDSIDQNSDSSNCEENYNSGSKPMLEYSNSLGKRDNISIDYDEIFDDIVSDSKSQTSQISFGCEVENYSTVKDFVNSNIDVAPSHSESLEGFDIPEISLCKSNFDTSPLKSILDMKTFSNIRNNCLEKNCNFTGLKNKSVSESNVHNKEICKNIISPVREALGSQRKTLNCETYNPRRMSQENINNLLQTPRNNEYVIKTNQVTPMLDYVSMSSPERHKELEKYGLKPFKRKRAIQLLTYLYNQTHPIVETEVDNSQSPLKRQKMHDESEQYNTPKKASQISKLSLGFITDVSERNDLYAVTNDHPDIRNLECDDDWVFQKREKAKVRSCRVPLHIAFHNYVSCRERLKEAILCYEPVNIDVIHKGLVANGYRYNPKDLLRFMDKKCITVKTVDNNTRKRQS